MKISITNGLSILLAGLMIFNPVVLLSQSSQHVISQEDIADTFDIVNDLIRELEALEPNSDGHYTLELDESQAGLSGLIGTMFLMGDKPNDLNRQAQDRLRQEIRRVEDDIDGQRNQISSDQRIIERNQNDLRLRQRNRYWTNKLEVPLQWQKWEPEGNEQVNEQIIEKHNSVLWQEWERQQSGQIWEYNNSGLDGEGRRRLEKIGIGWRHKNQIIYSKRMSELEWKLQDLARKHQLVIYPEFHLNVQSTSRYNREVFLDFDQSFITIRNPRQPSVTIDKKSLQQIIDGESFSLEGLWGRSDGTAIAHQLKNDLSQIALKPSENTIVKINVKPFWRKWGRRLLVLGLLGGGLYYWFFSDKSQEQAWLSDLMYRITINSEEHEALLNQLHEEKATLMNSQNSSNNENGLLDF